MLQAILLLKVNALRPVFLSYLSIFSCSLDIYPFEDNTQGYQRKSSAARQIEGIIRS